METLAYSREPQTNTKGGLQFKGHGTRVEPRPKHIKAPGNKTSLFGSETDPASACASASKPHERVSIRNKSQVGLGSMGANLEPEPLAKARRGHGAHLKSTVSPIEHS